MEPIKIELSKGAADFQPVNTFDGLACLRVGGFEAGGVLEVLRGGDTLEMQDQNPTAVAALFASAPSFVTMCGALFGLSYLGDDLEAEKVDDLEAYGNSVVRAIDSMGVTFSDLVVVGAILYADVERRLGLDRKAMERANFTARIKGAKRSST